MQILQFLNSLDPTSSFLDELPSSIEKFSDVIESEKKQSTAKIIKVEDLTYKVEADSDPLTKKVEDKPVQKNDSVVNKDEDIKQQDDNNEIVVPLFQLQIIPLDTKPFISQLPHNLTSFIKEMVVIFKTYNESIKAYDYNFQFKNLNLDVLFSQLDNGVKIVVSISDKELQKDLTKDRQELMASYLKKELDLEQIELEFEFLSLSSDEQKGNSQQSDQEPSSEERDMDEIPS